jgi:peptide deformylase
MNYSFRFFVSMLLTTMSLNQCDKKDESLSLDIPPSEFEILQQIPVGQVERENSALYLPPRAISASEFNSPELYTFIDSMYALMQRKSGVGIAANQLGKRLQLFIIEAKSDNPRYRVLGAVPKQLFINPVITNVSPIKKNFWHGCLSAVGMERGNVATYEWLEYRSKNERGEVQTGRLDGFAAVIFQHEFRHLMNGTYLDVARQFLSKPELDQKVQAGDIPFFENAPDTLPLLIRGYSIGQTLDEFHAEHKRLRQKS